MGVSASSEEAFHVAKIACPEEAVSSPGRKAGAVKPGSARDTVSFSPIAISGWKRRVSFALSPAAGGEKRKRVDLAKDPIAGEEEMRVSETFPAAACEATESEQLYPAPHATSPPTGT